MFDVFYPISNLNPLTLILAGFASFFNADSRRWYVKSSFLSPSYDRPAKMTSKSAQHGSWKPPACQVYENVALEQSSKSTKYEFQSSHGDPTRECFLSLFFFSLFRVPLRFVLNCLTRFLYMFASFSIRSKFPLTCYHMCCTCFPV